MNVGMSVNKEEWLLFPLVSLRVSLSSFCLFAATDVSVCAPVSFFTVLYGETRQTYGRSPVAECSERLVGPPMKPPPNSRNKMCWVSRHHPQRAPPGDAPSPQDHCSPLVSSVVFFIVFSIVYREDRFVSGIRAHW